MLTSLGTDPCAGAAPTTNANLRAVCIAQGAPAGTIGSITNPTAGQANITTGGNLNLKPEEAETYTFGAVFQPSFVPRFSVSVDYYNIKVKKRHRRAAAGRSIVGAASVVISAASASSADCTSSVATRSPAVSTAIRRPPVVCSRRSATRARCRPTVST